LGRRPGISSQQMPTRPLWAEVSRHRLLANYKKLLRMAGSQAELMPVVKANAYGHDVLACAPLLAAAGARWLGVTSTEEGVAVRAVCPESRILLMSGIFRGEADTVIDQGLTPVVWEPWQLDVLEEAGVRRSMAAGSVAVHLEIDTGMARQGVRVADAPAILPRFQDGSCVRLEGVMTHFSAPETMSSVRPNAQLAGLESALKLMVDRGLRPQWLHAGNSSSVIAGPDREILLAMAARMGAGLMLRPGLALYGYLDRITLDGLSWEGEPGLAPVLAWKTQVTSLRTVQAGEAVGYGGSFVAERETRLALLPVGYADGYNRLLSNRGYVLVRGQRASIAGRVSMDQTVVDVTEIAGVAVGEEVVLLGRQGGDSVDAWELADLAETVPWEVLCAISSRVPRVVVD
jgi:alanine racemase